MPETKLEDFESAAAVDPAEQPPAAVPPAPEPEKPVARATVNFEVWARLSGMRFDQLAGFRNHVKRQKLGPMTVLEWRAAFQKFLETPTN